MNSRPPIPMHDFSTCRSVKSTPLHKSQAEHGAVFEQQLNLYERAAWFDYTPFEDDSGRRIVEQVAIASCKDCDS